MSDVEVAKPAAFGLAAFAELVGPAVEYTADVVQRQTLFLDTYGLPV